MKNKLFSRAAALAAFALACFLLPSAAKAQAKCPYTIQNNLNCKAFVTYYITQPNNCSSVCASGWGTVPPGGNITIPCSDFCGPLACNLIVEVSLVDGSTPTPNPISVDRFNTAASGTSPSNCSTINMNWSNNSTQINP